MSLSESDRYVIWRMVALNPGWTNSIYSMELGVVRHRIRPHVEEARKAMGISSSQNGAAMKIDREKYEAVCATLGVDPVPGTSVARMISSPDGRQHNLKDNPFVRRGQEAPEDPTLRTLIVKVRAAMLRLDYCRLTISPDAILAGKIVDEPI